MNQRAAAALALTGLNTDRHGALVPVTHAITADGGSAGVDAVASACSGASDVGGWRRTTRDAVV